MQMNDVRWLVQTRKWANPSTVDGRGGEKTPGLKSEELAHADKQHAEKISSRRQIRLKLLIGLISFFCQNPFIEHINRPSVCVCVCARLWRRISNSIIEDRRRSACLCLDDWTWNEDRMSTRIANDLRQWSIGVERRREFHQGFIIESLANSSPVNRVERSGSLQKRSFRTDRADVEWGRVERENKFFVDFSLHCVLFSTHSSCQWCQPSVSHVLLIRGGNPVKKNSHFFLP